MRRIKKTVECKRILGEDGICQLAPKSILRSTMVYLITLSREGIVEYLK